MHTFLRRCTTKSYKKGDVILQQDATPGGAFIVKQGVVKVYNLTSSGEEKPIGFSTKDELFPLGWILGKIFRSQYYYEALSDCQVYCAPLDELQAFIKQNSEAMYEVLDRCVGKMLHHQMHINALEQSKASEKVLHAIHHLALCFGHDLKTDVVEIPLPLTQQDVANFTGLTRETVSVELKKLASQKIILSRNRNFVVLTDKLNVLLDDEYEQHLIRENVK